MKKKKDELAFTVRIYRESVEKLDYIASAYDRSRNNVINQAVRAYIAQYEDQHGKITLEDLQSLKNEAGE